MSFRLAGLATASARRVRGAVRDATLAASVHNSQPWHFVVGTGRVQILLDPRARPTVIDPDGRWALASVGAAATNLELGLRCRLQRAVHLEILPGTAADDVARALTGSSHEPVPVVVATWDGPPAVPGASERELHAAIPGRHTTRWPLYGEVDQDAWGLLDDVVRSDGDGASRVGSVRPDAAQTQRLLELTAAVDKTWSNDVAYLAEIERWTRVREGRGIPVRAYGPRDESGRMAARDFSVGVSGGHWRPADDRFEVSPQLLVITAESDDALAWVGAGRAMQRAMLAAVARGLGVGVLGQLVEDPGSRHRAGEVLGLPAGASVQQVLRLGQPGAEHKPASTPRRPLRRVMSA